MKGEWRITSENCAFDPKMVRRMQVKNWLQTGLLQPGGYEKSAKNQGNRQR
jgi:hypothetical protein